MTRVSLSRAAESKAEGSGGPSAESGAVQGTDSELDRYIYTSEMLLADNTSLETMVSVL